MSAAVRLPPGLREMYGAARLVPAEGATVGDVVAHLESHHPGLSHRLVDGGRLRRHIIVFVGDDQASLDTPVPDGATVTVVTAVAGG